MIEKERKIKRANVCDQNCTHLVSGSHLFRRDRIAVAVRCEDHKAHVAQETLEDHYSNEVDPQGSLDKKK